MTSPTARRRVALAALAAAPLTLAAGSAGAPAGATAGKTVVLKDIDFTPSKLVVSKGTTVTWRWNDDTTRHDVRSVGKLKFKGSGLRSSGTHRVTFRKAGTYGYVCTVHPGMKGSVRVR